MKICSLFIWIWMIPYPHFILPEIIQKEYMTLVLLKLNEKEKVNSSPHINHRAYGKTVPTHCMAKKYRKLKELYRPSNILNHSISFYSILNSIFDYMFHFLLFYLSDSFSWLCIFLSCLATIWWQSSFFSCKKVLNKFMNEFFLSTFRSYLKPLLQF